MSDDAWVHAHETALVSAGSGIPATTPSCVAFCSWGPPWPNPRSAMWLACPL